MNQKSFESEMLKAQTLARLEPDRADWWAGYQRGLRRRFHGENFGTEAEHEAWMELGIGDESRCQRTVGYRAGLGIQTARLRNLFSGEVVDVFATTDSPDSSYGFECWVDGNGQGYGQIQFGAPLGFELVEAP